jgi:hypothetical protein
MSRFIPKRVFQVAALLTLAATAVAWVAAGRRGMGPKGLIEDALSGLGAGPAWLLAWLLSLSVFVLGWAVLMLPLRRYTMLPTFREELATLGAGSLKELGAQSMRAAAQSHERTWKAIWGTPLNTAGMFVCLSAIVLPPMLTWFARPDLLPALMAPRWLVLMAAGAALGGALWCAGRAPLWLGAAAGALAAPGGLYTLSLWIRDRDHILRVEIALAVLVGTLPAAALFFAVRRLLLRRVR